MENCISVARKLEKNISIFRLINFTICLHSRSKYVQIFTFCSSVETKEDMFGYRNEFMRREMKE